MAYYVGNMPVGNDLSHHGIMGMKWGQRRYQNRDGSLTPAGRLRYGASSIRRSIGTGRKNLSRAAGTARRNTSGWYKKNKSKIVKGAKIAGTAAAVVGAAYLGKRYGKSAARAIGRVGRAAPGRLRGLGNKIDTRRAKIVVGARDKFGRIKNTKFVKDVGRAGRAAPGRVKGFGNKIDTKRAKFVVGARDKFGRISNTKAGIKIKGGYGKVKGGVQGVYGKAKTSASNLKRKRGVMGSNAAQQAHFDNLRKYRGQGKQVVQVTGAQAARDRAVLAGRRLGDRLGSAASKARTTGRNAVKGVASKSKNAVKGAASKSKDAVRGAATNVKGTAKRWKGNAGYAAAKAKESAKRNLAYVKKHPRRTAVSVGVRAGMGGLYYGHARRRGASKGQAAATGAARAVGGMRAGQAVGLGTRVYSGTKRAVKRYNSPSAKRYRAKVRASRRSRR